MPNTISAKFSHVVIIFIRILISILYLFCVYAFYLVCVYFIPGGKLEREEALNLCRDTTNTISQYRFQYPKYDQYDQYHLLIPSPIFYLDQYNQYHLSVPPPILKETRLIPIWPIPFITFQYQPNKWWSFFLSHTLLSPGVKQPYIRTAEGANGAFGTCCKMRHS